MKIYRHPSLAASLCLVLFLVLGLASGKSILSQLGGLMSDNSVSKGNVHDDAATGTVQDLESKQAASCDGQLAVALVQANDLAASARKEKDEASAKYGEALATIAGLQQDLAHTKSNLEKEIVVLTKIKDTTDQIIQKEKDRAAQELEGTKTKAQQEYEALRDEKDAIFKALEEESVSALGSLREQANEEFQVLKKEADESISSLQAKLRMSNEELEATMRSELEKSKLDKETQIANLTADRDDTVAKLTESMETSAREAAEVLQKTQEEAAATIASLQADRDSKVAALTQEIETAAQKAAEVLQTTKDEAKAFLKQQLEAKKDESDQAKLVNEERLSEKNQNIQKLQEYTEQMLEKKAGIERSLEEFKVEITHWRDLHAHRSYCNITHVSADLYDAGLTVYAKSVKQAGVASEVVMAQVSKGVEKSKRFVHGQVGEHWLAIEPLYQEHVANNYQTHLEPHLQNHVFPRLHEASVGFRATIVPLVIKAIEEIKQTYKTKLVPVMEEKYQMIVNMYGYYCKLYLREFQKASQESDILKDHPPPAYLLESWQTSCANPRESLSALMNGTLTLLALIFYRRVFGLVWWMGTFSLSLVILPLRWTPLGWFLPRRSMGSDKPSELPTAVENSGSAESKDGDHDVNDEMNGSSDETSGSADAKLY